MLCDGCYMKTQSYDIWKMSRQMGYVVGFYVQDNGGYMCMECFDVLAINFFFFFKTKGLEVFLRQKMTLKWCSKFGDELVDSFFQHTFSVLLLIIAAITRLFYL